MAGFNHNLDSLKTLGTDRVKLFVLISCNTAAPSILDTNCPNAGVTHPTTGTYQLSLPDLPKTSNPMIGVDLGNNASANFTVLYDDSSLSTGVLKIYTLSAGVAADLPSPAKVAVELTFKSTSVTRP